MSVTYTAVLPVRDQTVEFLAELLAAVAATNAPTAPRGHDLRMYRVWEAIVGHLR